MLAAEIRKKLGRALACSACRETSDTSAFFGFEDVLTSNVFGALRYLEPRYGVGPVLADLGLDPIETATITFWEEAGGCEPDVVIDLGHTIVVVETKLHAPFGADQLPREVIFAHQRAAGRPWRLLCATDHPREPLHVSYSSEREGLLKSLAPLGHGVASYFSHVNETGLAPAEIAQRVVWMPWDRIAALLEQVRETLKPPPHALALLNDLLLSLERRGLRRPVFHGFGTLPAVRLEIPRRLWASNGHDRRPPNWSIPEFSGGWIATPWSVAQRRFFGFGSTALPQLGLYQGWFLRRT